MVHVAVIVCGCLVLFLLDVFVCFVCGSMCGVVCLCFVGGCVCVCVFVCAVFSFV